MKSADLVSRFWFSRSSLKRFFASTEQAPLGFPRKVTVYDRPMHE
jgi:hypothetical protein